MKVTVEVHSTLKTRMAKKNIPLDIEPEGSIKVKDLIVKLGLTPGEVGLVINHGQILTLDDEIEDGMNLSLYPLFGGG